MLTERLKLQLVEKDKAAGALQRQVTQLEARLGETGDELREYSSATGAAPGERATEVDAMHEALRRIAAEVNGDFGRGRGGGGRDSHKVDPYRVMPLGVI